MKAALYAGIQTVRWSGVSPGVLNNWNWIPPQGKFVFLVEENGGIDLGSEVPGPRANGLRGTSEGDGIARRKEALKPGDIVHKLNVVSLRDDCGSRFLPQRNAADVVGMTMRQDDVLHGTMDFGRQEFPGDGSLRRGSRVDDDVSGRRLDQIHVAGGRSQIDGVADLDEFRFLWLLSRGIGGRPESEQEESCQESE